MLMLFLIVCVCVLRIHTDLLNWGHKLCYCEGNGPKYLDIHMHIQNLECFFTLPIESLLSPSTPCGYPLVLSPSFLTCCYLHHFYLLPRVSPSPWSMAARSSKFKLCPPIPSWRGGAVVLCILQFVLTGTSTSGPPSYTITFKRGWPYCCHLHVFTPQHLPAALAHALHSDALSRVFSDLNLAKSAKDMSISLSFFASHSSVWHSRASFLLEILSSWLLVFVMATPSWWSLVVYFKQSFPQRSLKCSYFLVKIFSLKEYLYSVMSIRNFIILFPLWGIYLNVHNKKLL